MLKLWTNCFEKWGARRKVEVFNLVAEDGAVRPPLDQGAVSLLGSKPQDASYPPNSDLAPPTTHPQETLLWLVHLQSRSRLNCYGGELNETQHKLKCPGGMPVARRCKESSHLTLHMKMFLFTDLHSCVEWDFLKSRQSGLTTEYFFYSEGFVSRAGSHPSFQTKAKIRAGLVQTHTYSAACRGHAHTKY